MAKGVRISISVDGIPEFDRIFRRMDLSLSDLTPVWEETRDAFWEIEKEQFASEGAAGGAGRFERLSPKYEKVKARRYPGKPILEATGRMRAAYTSKTSDSVVQISRDSLTVGGRGKVGRIAAYHQRGGGRLPQRKVISFSESQKRRMTKRLQKRMLKEMRRRGLPVQD